MDIQELQRLLNHYEELKKIAQQLHHLDEASCNYGLTPHQEKREEKLELSASGIAHLMGFAIYRQGDPRGWPLYLVPNDGSNHETDYNNYIGITPHK